KAKQQANPRKRPSKKPAKTANGSNQCGAAGQKHGTGAKPPPKDPWQVPNAKKDGAGDVTKRKLSRKPTDDPDDPAPF
ncbi:hypothetical protein, partial [Arthrobacter castelli]|uniref:hypothetical protein n=1 Tax=Arthrobacter castelli TaxID=271431 RepID=UPI0005680BA9